MVKLGMEGQKKRYFMLSRNCETVEKKEFGRWVQYNHVGS
jgi:hypothetical protein